MPCAHVRMLEASDLSAGASTYARVLLYSYTQILPSLPKKQKRRIVSKRRSAECTIFTSCTHSITKKNKFSPKNSEIQDANAKCRLNNKRLPTRSSPYGCVRPSTSHGGEVEGSVSRLSAFAGCVYASIQIVSNSLTKFACRSWGGADGIWFPGILTWLRVEIEQSPHLALMSRIELPPRRQCKNPP